MSEFRWLIFLCNKLSYLCFPVSYDQVVVCRGALFSLVGVALYRVYAQRCDPKLQCEVLQRHSKSQLCLLRANHDVFTTTYIGARLPSQQIMSSFCGTVLLLLNSYTTCRGRTLVCSTFVLFSSPRWLYSAY